jgi:hypothetical protein
VGEPYTNGIDEHWINRPNNTITASPVQFPYFIFRNFNSLF